MSLWDLFSLCHLTLVQEVSQELKNYWLILRMWRCIDLVQSVIFCARSPVISRKIWFAEFWWAIRGTVFLVAFGGLGLKWIWLFCYVLGKSAKLALLAFCILHPCYYNMTKIELTSPVQLQKLPPLSNELRTIIYVKTYLWWSPSPYLKWQNSEIKKKNCTRDQIFQL